MLSIAFIGAFTIVVGLVALAEALARSLFEASYLGWLLENGALLAIVLALVSRGANLDAFPDLVSPNPDVYFKACLRLLAGALIFYDVGLQGAKIPGRADSGGPVSRAASALSRALDQAMARCFEVVLAVLAVAWLALVAPLQYFTFLVFGGPARVFSRSPSTTVFRSTTSGIEVKRQARSEAVPEGWIEAHPRERPVTLTASLVALALVAVAGIS